ncbi:sensor histidine kinase [Roseburia hominis]
MRIVWDYIKERAGWLPCIFLMEAVAFFALYLQGTKFYDISYAVELSLFVLVIMAGVDFGKYSHKRKKLSQAKKALLNDVSNLPETRSPKEREYQEMVQILFERKEEEAAKARHARQDMLDFYSLWVHQIKTPIAGLHLLLQAQKDGLAQEDWNQRMNMEVFRVEQYVEMVLSYLRMEDMSRDLVLKSYDLKQIVRQSVKKFSREFLYRKIRLELAEFERTILSDEKWILLVLEQILSNALKYTPEGGCISIYCEEGKNVLVIEDTGIGIPPEDLPRVFENGFTGYNGRENKKSTGIGLYLCRTVMDKLGHGIRIASEEGKGTKLYLDFEREERVNE